MAHSLSLPLYRAIKSEVLGLILRENFLCLHLLGTGSPSCGEGSAGNSLAPLHEQGCWREELMMEWVL